MERRIARCHCIRCGRADNRCPPSWPWTRTPCCTSCPMLTRTSCGSRADDPSSNTSRQDKAFLCGKKHIAKFAACPLMAGRAAGRMPLPERSRVPCEFMDCGIFFSSSEGSGKLHHRRTKRVLWGLLLFTCGTLTCSSRFRFINVYALWHSPKQLFLIPWPSKQNRDKSWTIRLPPWGPSAFDQRRVYRDVACRKDQMTRDVGFASDR
jgi:hypothetical protein